MHGDAGDGVVGRGRALLKPNALCPEPQRLPMDADGHLECQQRIRDECAQQTGIAQRPPLAGEACHHQRPLVVAGSDVYRDVFAGEADAKAIVQSHGHERRNVEALVAVLPDSLVVPVADRDQVAVALPKGGSRRGRPAGYGRNRC